MNNEIKEMLDDMKEIADCEYTTDWFELNYEDTKILLDYITNLQEENQRLIKNQRYYKNGVFSLEYDKETLSDMIDDYKSRIDKAMNICEPLVEWGECTINGKILKQIYGILKGE